MTIETKTMNINELTVFYKFRTALQDRKHLIVIFSGFRKIDTYDFDGAPANGLRANILWIQDNFNDNYSYYLRSNMNDTIEKAVHELIEQTRTDLGLEKSNVSLAGFSKGGSAALYYGIKYNYGAIISVAPQFKIGSYVYKNWEKVHEYMTGSASLEDTEVLDSLIPNLIENDGTINRNIYLFSSEADPQHKNQVEPNLSGLSKYDNFNYIDTKSPIVDSHNIVTRYNVPLITSILSALTDNAVPKFGKVANGSSHHHSSLEQPTLQNLRDKKTAISSITRLEIQKDRLYVEGNAFIKGYEADSYSSIRVKLIMNANGQGTHIPVGTVRDKDLSYHFYESVYCNYSYGAFATLGNKGIGFDEIPNGKSIISLNIKQGGRDETKPVTSTRSLSTWHVIGTDLAVLNSSSSEVSITRRPALGLESADTYFTLERLESRGTRLFIEGYFIQPGFETPNYGDVGYYLVLSDVDTHSIEYTLAIASDHKNDTHDLISDEWHDYSKSFYTTRGYKGVDLAHVLPGKYKLAISARYRDFVFTKQLDNCITVEAINAPSTHPTISVVGSCVSRDIFNAKLVPKWKALYSLGTEHYQSSIVSLMAPPIPIEPNAFDDLDSHSRAVTARDFSKSFIGEIISNPPSAILFDFYADARFGVLALASSFVTNNEWKLQQSNYYKTLESPNAMSMGIDRESYLDRFREAIERFSILRDAHFPETQIIINRARGVSTYVAPNMLGQFSKQEIDSLNSRWDDLEKEFHKIMGGDFVTGMSDNQMGNGGHPWGPGPVHYQPSYYRRLQENLLLVASKSSTLFKLDNPIPPESLTTTIFRYIRNLRRKILAKGS